MNKMQWLQLFTEQEQPEPGVQADAAPEQEQDRAQQFRALIQGPYKQDYDRQVQTIVRERLKNCAKSERVLQALGPALQTLCGIDVQQLSEQDANDWSSQVAAQSKAAEQTQQERFAQLQAQFDTVRARYPQAVLSQELDNEVFVRLVARGVEAADAYELAHLDELRRGAMAYGARRAREELTAAMRAGYLRPREGGMAHGADAFAGETARWSRQEREELKTRVRRGEQVRL